MKRKCKVIKKALFLFLSVTIFLAIPIAWQAHVSANNRSVKAVWEEHLTANTNGHCACDQEGPNDPIAAQLVRFQTDDVTTWSSFPGGRLYTKNEAYGYLDVDGEIVIPAKYYFTTMFSEGLAVATASGRPVDYSTGYINSSGNWVISPSFVSAYDFKCGRGRYYIHTKSGHRIYGYVKHDGTKVAGTMYGSATDFHCGVAMVGVERLWSKLVMRGYFMEEAAGEFGLRRSYIYRLIDVDGNTLSKDDIAKMNNINDSHNNSVKENLP